MNFGKKKVYFDFCKHVLTDSISDKKIVSKFFKEPNSLSESDIETVLNSKIEEKFMIGNIWPEKAHTMIGIKRLDNLQFCIENVIKNNVEGDLIETGVWRGGAAIFMRIILKTYGVVNKIVFAADSFEGLPPPDPKYPKDEKDKHHTVDYLRVPLEEVKQNFKKYGVFDDKVRFLKGWFSETMKDPPFQKLCILRLDGDMYASTWEVLENLYDKLSKGGFVIIDDYANHALKGCKAAVDDFREKRNVTEQMQKIDWTGIYWQKN